MSSNRNTVLREKLLRWSERLAFVSFLPVLQDFSQGGEITLPKVVALSLGLAVSAGLYVVAEKLGKRKR